MQRTVAVDVLGVATFEMDCFDHLKTVSRSSPGRLESMFNFLPSSRCTKSRADSDVLKAEQTHLAANSVCKLSADAPCLLAGEAKYKSLIIITCIHTKDLRNPMILFHTHA